MAEQQLKPALGPLEQTLANIRGGGLSGLLETINPELRNRPDYQNLKKGAKFAYETITDPLNLITSTPQGLVAAGMFKGIPAFLIKPYMKAVEEAEQLKRTIVRERNNIATDGRAAEVAEEKAKQELIKVNARIKSLEKDIKTETGLEVPQAPMLSTNQGILDLINNPKNIFHGSQKKGIGSFELPKGYGSEGGLYLVDKFIDPRLKQFARGMPSQGGPGSAYITEPNFKNILTVGDTSKQMDRLLKNLEADLAQPLIKNRFMDVRLSTEPAFQVKQLRKNVVGVPTNFSKAAGEGLRNIGIDAIRIPNKRRGVDNSDTFISLNPSENLNILDEIPYEDIEGLIKELMKR